jgi:hypothetical protein
MKETPMDLDTLLRDTASVADPTAHDLAAGRSALDAATMISARRVAWVRRAKRRGLGLSAILAAAASLVLITGPMLSPGPRPTSASPVAASPTATPGSSQPAHSPTVNKGEPTANKGEPTAPVTLNVSLVLFRAANAAGTQPGGWPDAAYWRTISSYHQGTGPTMGRTIWMGHTAAGVLKDPRVSSGIIPLEVGSFDGFTWDQLYALPTDSRALESKLRATSLNGGRDDNSELFTLVGSLISESPAPPALRKALWEIASRIPGVTLVGAVKDSIGRPGTEIRRGFEGYVLNPNDGRLLERYEGTSAPVPEAPGGTNWRATFLEQGPVDSAPAATPSSPPTP